eukprot:6547893-Pyramimonas_sp.AAC.1
MPSTTASRLQRRIHRTQASQILHPYLASRAPLQRALAPPSGGPARTRRWERPRGSPCQPRKT